ncbi:hypothetical protein OROHE_021410 [Orobanche hederae]
MKNCRDIVPMHVSEKELSHEMVKMVKKKEIRYQQCYVDLILASEIRQIFKTRFQIVRYMRSYLDEHDFLEVKTLMMNMIAENP